MIVSTRTVACVLAVTVATACSSPPIDPPTGDEIAADDVDVPAPSGSRVGVVLPPADEFDPRILDGIRRDANLVQIMGADQVRDVRVVTPDDDVFVSDLVDLLTRDRYELTCALTTGASTAVRSAYDDAPDQRFCLLVTTELDTEEPAGLSVAVLRTAELGYVVGTIAAAATTSGTVAVVLGPHDLERGRLRDGMLAALAGVDVVDRQIDDDPTEVLATAIEAGADVVIVGSGPRAAEVAAAAIDADLAVLAPSAVVDEFDRASLVATWRIQWHRVLRGPVDRLLGRANPAPLSVGLAEDAFVISPGSSMTPTVNARMRTAITRLVDGGFDPLAPEPAPASPPNAPTTSPSDGSEGQDASNGPSSSS
ncbi:MAG: hypothetical protein WD011_08570 [Nitriliruptoraceae bacterium]